MTVFNSPDPKDHDTINEIKMPEATLKLRRDGIVHVTFNKNITLDVPLQLRLLEKHIEITGGKKCPFVFDALEGATITREARNNAILIEDQSPANAVAVVADTLAYKIIANF